MPINKLTNSLGVLANERRDKLIGHLQWMT